MTGHNMVTKSGWVQKDDTMFEAKNQCADTIREIAICPAKLRNE